MQIENDYDRDVYNGDLGIVTEVDGDNSELAVDFEGRIVSTARESSMSSRSPMRRRSTRARARNTTR
jgi:ATP-dependent exoDNAse (exonuclease V) alpha subunit